MSKGGNSPVGRDAYMGRGRLKSTELFSRRIIQMLWPRYQVRQSGEGNKYCGRKSNSSKKVPQFWASPTSGLPKRATRDGRVSMANNEEIIR